MEKHEQKKQTKNNNYLIVHMQDLNYNVPQLVTERLNLLFYLKRYPSIF